MKTCDELIREEVFPEIVRQNDGDAIFSKFSDIICNKVNYLFTWPSGCLQFEADKMGSNSVACDRVYVKK